MAPCHQATAICCGAIELTDWPPPMRSRFYDRRGEAWDITRKR